MEDAKAAGAINFHELVADDRRRQGLGRGHRHALAMRASPRRCSRRWPEEGINIKVITTSEIKISVLIDRKYMELAVQALHDAFELEKAA